MTDDMRRFLLQQTSPPVDSPVAALRLLVEQATEVDELLRQATRGERPDPDAVASYHRRRAYVLAHLARIAPEFAEAATASISRWAEAEEDATRAAVEGHPAS